MESPYDTHFQFTTGVRGRHAGPVCDVANKRQNPQNQNQNHTHNMYMYMCPACVLTKNGKNTYEITQKI